jgi:hypothetical protein
MAIRSLSAREIVLYILLGGVVIFVAVFLGIRTGFALRGGGPGKLTPENLPNRTNLKIGDVLPALEVKTADSVAHPIGDILRGKPTVIVVVLPGCDPCKNLLTTWRESKLFPAGQEIQMIVLAAVSPGEYQLGELEEFGTIFPCYFTDFLQMDKQCGISGFPSLIGVGGDNKIRFIASGYAQELDRKFFEKYL